MRTLLHPHQGDPDPARPRPAAAGGTGVRGRHLGLGGLHRPELWRTVEPGTPRPNGASAPSAPSPSTASAAGS
ncbi:hypothetical protein DUI70_7168 [Streptomyces albus]|nr:hypothetical protein DUI70_7168 [Streptomyces albus]